MELAEKLLDELRETNGVQKNGYTWISSQATRSLIYALQDYLREQSDLRQQNTVKEICSAKSKYRQNDHCLSLNWATLDMVRNCPLSFWTNKGLHYFLVIVYCKNNKEKTNGKTLQLGTI